MTSVFCYDRDSQDLSSWLGGWIFGSDLQPSYDEPDSGDDVELMPVTKSALYDDGWRARPRRKAMTLRSWRRPEAVGGPERRSAIRKMDHRLSQQPPIRLYAHH